MEIYGRVRRAVRVEGKSQRAVSQGVWASRETVRKMLQYAVAPRLSAAAADQAAQAGAVVGRHRRHFGRRQAEASQAAAHVEADFREIKERARIHGRLHDREGLRAHGDAARPGECLCLWCIQPARRRWISAKRWWRWPELSIRRIIWRWVLPHSDDCFVAGVSGRDNRGISGRPCKGLCLLRRRAHADPLRQHQDRGSEDPGR